MGFCTQVQTKVIEKTSRACRGIDEKLFTVQLHSRLEASDQSWFSV